MTNSAINAIPKNQQSPYAPQSFFDLTVLVLTKYVPIWALHVFPYQHPSFLLLKAWPLQSLS